MKDQMMSRALSPTDKVQLNQAISNLILSSLRPYELANEPSLEDLIRISMEVGARHGANRSFKFDLSGSNKLIGGDGVRKGLDKTYEEIVLY